MLHKNNQLNRSFTNTNPPTPFLNDFFALLKGSKNLFIWHSAYTPYIECAYKIIQSSQEYEAEQNFNDYDNIIILGELDWALEEKPENNYADFAGLNVLKKLAADRQNPDPNYIFVTFFDKNTLKNNIKIMKTLFLLTDQLVDSNGLIDSKKILDLPETSPKQNKISKLLEFYYTEAINHEGSLPDSLQMLKRRIKKFIRTGKTDFEIIWREQVYPKFKKIESDIYSQIPANEINELEQTDVVIILRKMVTITSKLSRLIKANHQCEPIILTEVIDDIDFLKKCIVDQVEKYEK